MGQSESLRMAKISRTSSPNGTELVPTFGNRSHSSGISSEWQDNEFQKISLPSLAEKNVEHDRSFDCPHARCVRACTLCVCVREREKDVTVASVSNMLRHCIIFVFSVLIFAHKLKHIIHTHLYSPASTSFRQKIPIR